MGLVAGSVPIAANEAYGRFDSSGGGGDDSDMEKRVADLEALAGKTSEKLTGIETRLTKIEAKLDLLPSIFATKADLAEAKAAIIMWVVGAVLLAQLLPAVLRALPAGP